jgi:hypothetical protein
MLRAARKQNPKYSHTSVLEESDLNTLHYGPIYPHMKLYSKNDVPLEEAVKKIVFSPIAEIYTHKIICQWLDFTFV